MDYILFTKRVSSIFKCTESDLLKSKSYIKAVPINVLRRTLPIVTSSKTDINY